MGNHPGLPGLDYARKDEPTLDYARHWITRPKRRTDTGLRPYDQLINRIVELRQEGRTIKQIAAQLNKIPEGLHEHVGAEALVSLRADPWEDRDQATRSPRVVVAGLGPRASNASGQAAHLGATRLGSRAAGPAARSVGRLGRWAGTTPTVEAHGRLAFEQVCGTNVVMKKVISFEILIPYIHSAWIGDQAL